MMRGGLGIIDLDLDSRRGGLTAWVRLNNGSRCIEQLPGTKRQSHASKAMEGPRYGGRGIQGDGPLSVPPTAKPGSADLIALGFAAFRVPLRSCCDPVDGECLALQLFRRAKGVERGSEGRGRKTLTPEIKRLLACGLSARAPGVEGVREARRWCCSGAERPSTRLSI